MKQVYSIGSRLLFTAKPRTSRVFATFFIDEPFDLLSGFQSCSVETCPMGGATFSPGPPRALGTSMLSELWAGMRTLQIPSTAVAQTVVPSCTLLEYTPVKSPYTPLVKTNS